jgi:hypothetical protein
MPNLPIPEMSFLGVMILVFGWITRNQGIESGLFSFLMAGWIIDMLGGLARTFSGLPWLW